MSAETKIQSVEINGVAVPLLFEQSKICLWGVCSLCLSVEVPMGLRLG